MYKNSDCLYFSQFKKNTGNHLRQVFIFCPIELSLGYTIILNRRSLVDWLIQSPSYKGITMYFLNKALVFVFVLLSFHVSCQAMADQNPYNVILTYANDDSLTDFKALLAEQSSNNAAQLELIQTITSLFNPQIPIPTSQQLQNLKNMLLLIFKEENLKMSMDFYSSLLHKIFTSNDLIFLCKEPRNDLINAIFRNRKGFEIINKKEKYPYLLKVLSDLISSVSTTSSGGSAINDLPILYNVMEQAEKCQLAEILTGKDLNYLQPIAQLIAEYTIEPIPVVIPEIFSDPIDDPFLQWCP